MMSIEQGRLNLSQLGLEMFLICEDQLKNTREAFFSLGKDLAEKIIHTGKRVNVLDLQIDRECERFLALHQPVAKDLRFTLGLRKINFGLERLGDYCFGISKFIAEIDDLPANKLLYDLRVYEMFSITLSMLQVVKVAFDEVDSTTARKIFKKEQMLNEIQKEAIPKICKEVKRNPWLIDHYLLLFSVIKKLERVGDLMTNISEEIMFYCEAEIWKHQKEKFEWD